MASYDSEQNWNGDDQEQDDHEPQRQQNQKEKKANALPIWGNERSMNLNPLILTNIQSSHYFKVDLYELKTYHEVIDEIYYKVQHLEPWEKGSRKTAGQTGMCGGVRGVGAGGIVSTAYCLLYKLFTLKLTRKQVNGLITHKDSPYIRGLGFMYIRYTQPPADLWEWYDPYLEDPEEVDVKAGGGVTMTVGTMLKSFLTKLEWFSTLFPRIPVPIQQKIQRLMAERFPSPPPGRAGAPAASGPGPGSGPGRTQKASNMADEADGDKYPKRRDSPGKGAGRDREGERERESYRGGSGPRDGTSFLRDTYRDRDVKSHRDQDRDPYVDRDRGRYRDYERDRERDRERGRGQRERSRERDRERERPRGSGSGSGFRDDRERYRRPENSRDRDREHRRHREYDHNDSRHKSSSYR